MLQIDLFAWANSSQAFFALSIILPFWPLSADMLPSLSHGSVEKLEQSACYVVSDELNVMFPIMYFFFIDFQVARLFL